MNIFRNIFNKKIKPYVEKKSCGLTGAMTLDEAMAEVKPIAKKLDSEARMTLVTSGLDIQLDGRSLCWEFIFILPTRNATMMLSLKSDQQTENPDEAAVQLTERVNHIIATDLKRPVLPEQSRNSPEVVAALASQGVDFVAGPSDMKIESRISETGEALWVTYYYDKEYTTYF